MAAASSKSGPVRSGTASCLCSGHDGMTDPPSIALPRGKGNPSKRWEGLQQPDVQLIKPRTLGDYTIQAAAS